MKPTALALGLVAAVLALGACTAPPTAGPACTIVPASQVGGLALDYASTVEFIRCEAGATATVSVLSGHGFGVSALTLDRDPVTDWTLTTVSSPCPAETKDVSPQVPRVEVFPCAGVVTFTASHPDPVIYTVGNSDAPPYDTVTVLS